MGDDGLTPRCYRNTAGLHTKCVAAGAQLDVFQKVGDRWWCACQCHPHRGARPASGAARRRYDAWLLDYNRLMGSAEGLP